MKKQSEATHNYKRAKGEGKVVHIKHGDGEVLERTTLQEDGEPKSKSNNSGSEAVAGLDGEHRVGTAILVLILLVSKSLLEIVLVILVGGGRKICRGGLAAVGLLG